MQNPIDGDKILLDRLIDYGRRPVSCIPQKARSVLRVRSTSATTGHRQSLTISCTPLESGHRFL